MKWYVLLAAFTNDTQRTSSAADSKASMAQVWDGCSVPVTFLYPRDALDRSTASNDATNSGIFALAKRGNISACARLKEISKRKPGLEMERYGCRVGI